MTTSPRPLLPLAAGALLLALAGCSSDPVAQTGSDVAARVGALVITSAELDRRVATLEADPDVERAVAEQPGVAEQLAADTLAQMVQSRLLTEGADELGVVPTEAEVQAHLDEVVASSLPDRPDAWQQFLASSGYPEEEVRAQLTEDLVRERVEDALLPDPPVDAAEVDRAWAEGYEGRPRLAHVLVAERAEADQVLADAAAGVPFADLARDRSLDTASAVDGGELGPWSKGQYAAAFDEAVERHPQPGLVGPVATPFGFHVIEVRAAATRDEAAPLVSARLAEAAQDAAVMDWLAARRAAVTVELDPALGRWDVATGTVTR